MNPNAGPAMLMSLACAFIGGAIIGCPIFAVLLRAGAKWGANMEIDFGSALKTAFVVYFVNFLINIPFTFFSIALQADKLTESLIRLASIPVSFIAIATIINSLHQVSFGKALKITALIYLIGIAIGVILGVVMAFVFYAMNN